MRRQVRSGRRSRGCRGSRQRRRSSRLGWTGSGLTWRYAGDRPCVRILGLQLSKEVDVGRHSRALQKFTQGGGTLGAEHHVAVGAERRVGLDGSLAARARSCSIASSAKKPQRHPCLERPLRNWPAKKITPHMPSVKYRCAGCTETEAGSGVTRRRRRPVRRHPWTHRRSPHPATGA